MCPPLGHEQRSEIHRNALQSGLSVVRAAQVSSGTTLVEYDQAEGCYAYFALIKGSYRIDGSFDEIVAAWDRPEICLPMVPTFRIFRSAASRKPFTSGSSLLRQTLTLMTLPTQTATAG